MHSAASRLTHSGDNSRQAFRATGRRRQSWLPHRWFRPLAAYRSPGPAGRHFRGRDDDPHWTGPRSLSAAADHPAAVRAHLTLRGSLSEAVGPLLRGAIRPRLRPRRACPAHRAESQTHIRARGGTLGKEAWPDRRRHHASHQRQTGNASVTPFIRCLRW